MRGRSALYGIAFFSIAMIPTMAKPRKTDGRITTSTEDLTEEFLRELEIHDDAVGVAVDLTDTNTTTKKNTLTSTTTTATTVTTAIVYMDHCTPFQVLFANTLGINCEHTSRPSFKPSTPPTEVPTDSPSLRPTQTPSSNPTAVPTDSPSLHPTQTPSSNPTAVPTGSPTGVPSSFPSEEPSLSSVPSVLPSNVPTREVSTAPSVSLEPSLKPSTSPSVAPTLDPSAHPSSLPSTVPSVVPTTLSSVVPSLTPTSKPSTPPSKEPTTAPTIQPSKVPSVKPTTHPSDLPTNTPSNKPSVMPSSMPTSLPSVNPTTSSNPSLGPSVSSQPSVLPSTFPTDRPSEKPTSVPSVLSSTVPSLKPSEVPTDAPTVTSKPSEAPSMMPTVYPTFLPSAVPTLLPSTMPSDRPTAVPSHYYRNECDFHAQHRCTDRIFSNATASSRNVEMGSYICSPPTEKDGGVSRYRFGVTLPSFTKSGRQRTSDLCLCDGNLRVWCADLDDDIEYEEEEEEEESDEASGFLGNLVNIDISSRRKQQLQMELGKDGILVAFYDRIVGRETVWKSDFAPYITDVNPRRNCAVLEISSDGSLVVREFGLKSPYPKIYWRASPETWKGLHDLPTPRPTRSALPSNEPTEPPTVIQSVAPSVGPSSTPTREPLDYPSAAPTLSPSSTPTGAPLDYPSAVPTTPPSSRPTLSKRPSHSPTDLSSVVPTMTKHPSAFPTQSSSRPSDLPTVASSVPPTLTQNPTSAGPTLYTDRPTSSQQLFTLGNEIVTSVVVGAEEGTLGIRLSDGLVGRAVARSGQSVTLYDATATEPITSSVFPLAQKLTAIGCFDNDGRGDHPRGWTLVYNSCHVGGGGGVGTLSFDASGNIVKYDHDLTGSQLVGPACGGSLTPWGTWLTSTSGAVPDSQGLYEIDPFSLLPSSGYRRPPTRTAFGRANFHSVACDDRNYIELTCYATVIGGPLRRYQPSAANLVYGIGTGDFRGVLDSGGTGTFLMLMGGQKFSWTSDLRTAQTNSDNNYPEAGGVAVRDGRLYFVDRQSKRMFVLDLDKGTYVRSNSPSTFQGTPDSLTHFGFGGNSDSLLYVTEISSPNPGLYAWDLNGGTFHAYAEAPSDFFRLEGFVGPALCDQGRKLLLITKDEEVLYEISRKDGRAFQKPATAKAKRGPYDIGGDSHRLDIHDILVAAQIFGKDDEQDFDEADTSFSFDEPSNTNRDDPKSKSKGRVGASVRGVH